MMSNIAYNEQRCALCYRPSEYTSPNWLCRYHWTEWYADGDNELMKEMLLQTEIDYGPALEYWYHKLIREMEYSIENTVETKQVV